MARTKGAPDGHAFFLGWQVRRERFTLSVPDRMDLSGTLERHTLHPAARLESWRVTSVESHAAGWALAVQQASYRVQGMERTDDELEAQVLGRLKRRPSAMTALRTDLMIPGRTLGQVLDRLVSRYQIATIRPGQYLALPWVRLDVPVTVRPGTPHGYIGLSTWFWQTHQHAPVPTEEPSAEVREQAARRIERDRLDASTRAAREQAEQVRRQAEAARRRQLQQAADTVRRERLERKMQRAPWLVTPSGTIGLLVEGVRCRIDLQRLPDGKLWIFQQSSNRQITAGIREGQLYTWESAELGWVNASRWAVQHISAALLAQQSGQLQAYPLGAEVLDILLQ